MVYDLEGPAAAPLLVLVGSLGLSMSLWRPQMLALTSWFRVLRVEHPGHAQGVCEELPPGPYMMSMLGERILELLDHLGEERCCFMGLSLGGMIGMWLAANYPRRIERLVICCTAPAIGPRELWIERARAARHDGTRPSAELLLSRWFTPRFVAQHGELAAALTEENRRIDALAYANCCELLATTDLDGELGRIHVPTLVVAGALDPVISPQSAAQTMAKIGGARLTVLSDAAHLPNIEQPTAFNEAVVAHLVGSATERGQAARGAVLGDCYVVPQDGPEFKRHFDNLTTRMYWGEVWSRPGLDRRTRRLLNIGMLIALHHLDGVAIHTRAALRDGITPETLQELLLQAAVSAGIPAANAARAVVNRVIDEEGAGSAASRSGSTG